jgi:hypothetical protein
MQCFQFIKMKQEAPASLEYDMVVLMEEEGVAMISFLFGSPYTIAEFVRDYQENHTPSIAVSSG